MMPRVTAAVAAHHAGVTRTTLHRWVRQGRLPRHADGYDLADVLTACDSRNLDALLIRAGKCSAERAIIREHVRAIAAGCLTDRSR